jgi:hypothetical protein
MGITQKLPCTEGGHMRPTVWALVPWIQGCLRQWCLDSWDHPETALYWRRSYEAHSLCIVPWIQGCLRQVMFGLLGSPRNCPVLKRSYETYNLCIVPWIQACLRQWCLDSWDHPETALYWRRSSLSWTYMLMVFQLLYRQQTNQTSVPSLWNCFQFVKGSNANILKDWKHYAGKGNHFAKPMPKISNTIIIELKNLGEQCKLSTQKDFQTYWNQNCNCIPILFLARV